MKRRLQSIYWRGILITLVMAAIAIGGMVKLKADDTLSNLNAVLHAASLWTLESNADLQQMADSIAAVSQPVQVTFLMDTGLVLADSRKDADRSQDHYQDAEMIAARQGKIGRAFRLSTADATFVLYLAKRVSPQLILRVSYPVLEIVDLLVIYGISLLTLFLMLYFLQRKAVSRFAQEQVQQMEEVRRLLDGEVANAQAVFPEFQPTLHAIAYRVERLQADHKEIMRTLNLRSDFVANASHELRSPLTSIRGFAEMLQTGMADTPEEQALCATLICSECDRMLAVIEDILRLSKAERQPDRAPQTVDVAQIAHEICRSLAKRAEQKKIALCVDGALSLTAQEKDVWEILYNLLDNAIRYGREGGHVNIRLSPHQMIVADDGIGISPEHLPHIFEQFYRADDARDTETVGTGLGLSIVKALVERCHGQIRAESELGKGSRFIIDFTGEAA